MATVKLTTDQFKDKFFDYTTETEWNFKGETPAIVDFYADWCAPCRMMPPILKEVKDHFGDKLTILKIDVDKNPQVAAAYQVRGVPTLILFRSNEVLWRTSGVLPATQLSERITAATQL